MELSAGMILDGTVKTITKFGAFVALPENRTGMVHISEVAHTYVSDIRQHLTEGQEVKVMVLNLEDGKINLSIKRTQAPESRPNGGKSASFRERSSVQKKASAAEGEHSSFDDMLKRFMADSDNKISGLKQYSDHRTRTRKR